MFHRRSIRLKNYDYSRNGFYYITLCTHCRQKLFGNIEDGQMILNAAGEIAQKCWLAIPEHYPNVVLDEWVIMPDHIHGIIVINSNKTDRIISFNKDQNGIERNFNRYQHIIPRSLGCIIRGFKIGVTKLVREQNPGMIVWQRNYYERIIRNLYELKRARNYIRRNPENWKVKK